MDSLTPKSRPQPHGAKLESAETYVQIYCAFKEKAWLLGSSRETLATAARGEQTTKVDMVFLSARYIHMGQEPQTLFMHHLSTFGVDKERPAELKDINSVTGQASAKQNRGDTLGEDELRLAFAFILINHNCMMLWLVSLN